MKNWYAIQSKPRSESLAELHLQNQNFTTYLPKSLHRKRRRGEWTLVTEPLFPRYLIIHRDPNTENTAPIRSTKGLSTLVKIGH